MKNEQRSIILRLRTFYGFYRHEWTIQEDLDSLQDILVTSFLGEIYARVLWHYMGIAERRFDVKNHVEAFLYGYFEREQGGDQKGRE